MRPPEAPTRTIVLAAITAVLAIAWLARSFEIDTDELTGFFLMSLVLVAGMVILAALAVAITKVFRRLQDRSTKNRRMRGAK